MTHFSVSLEEVGVASHHLTPEPLKVGRAGHCGREGHAQSVREMGRSRLGFPRVDPPAIPVSTRERLRRPGYARIPVRDRWSLKTELGKRDLVDLVSGVRLGRHSGLRREHEGRKETQVDGPQGFSADHGLDPPPG